jgi:hypothetical protein
MATSMTNLEAWNDTKQALSENLHSVLALLVSAPFSTDPSSDYVRGHAEENRIVMEMKRHARLGIQLVDDEIAASGVVDQINAEAREAKQEADRIKDAAKSIDEISNAVDMVTGVVTKIAALL